MSEKTDEEKAATAAARAASRAKAMEEAAKRVAGYLVCDECGMSRAFTGLPNQPGGWPQHRCGFNVRSFDKLSKNDPNRAPLRVF